MATASIPVVSRDQEIARTTAELLTVGLRPGAWTLVLTGSLARGEGTWRFDGLRQRLVGDAEFLLVCEDRSALPSAETLQSIALAAEARLIARGVQAQIVISPVRVDYLRGLPPHIFGYELLRNGKVVYGNSRVLDLVPAFSANDIPLDDGFNLLSNRMLEMVEVLWPLDPDTPLPEAVRYRAVKLALDMGSSFLLFKREYRPTYRTRAARLAELAENVNMNSWFVRRLSHVVNGAVNYKLGKSQFPVEDLAGIDRLIDDARALWVWELQRLTGADSTVGDLELFRMWMTRQSAFGRIRGWASVVRRIGLRHSLSQFGRWMPLAMKGSPRRLIYQAASELLFALPGLVSDAPCIAENEAGWEQLRAQLPLEDESSTAPPESWRRLGHAVSENYRTLLEFTRS